jgi:uncharacterized damage-inducible protein DinB
VRGVPTLSAAVSDSPDRRRAVGQIRLSTYKQKMVEDIVKKWIMLSSLLLGVALVVVPLHAQKVVKSEAPKPALGSSAKVLEQWNEIGRKLIAIAEDLPEDKYDYKPNSDSRSFIQQLLHAAGSMYIFTDTAQGKAARYDNDPKRDGLQTKTEIVAFVKQSVKDGADLIKAKGDKGFNNSVNDGSPRLIRLGDLAYALIEHSGEHYGQLVVYYRVNNMVPPESRPKN